MTKILKNIVHLRKKLVEVSNTNFGIRGCILSASKDDILILKRIGSQYFREAYYPISNNDVDFGSIQEGEKIELAIDLGAIPNYYENFSTFLQANKIKCEHSTFYIQDLDYFEGISEEPVEIKNYKLNIELIQLLKDISDYQKDIAGDLELFFYKSDQGCTVHVYYDASDFQHIDQVKALPDIREHLLNKADSHERKQIFVNELINCLTQEGGSYKYLMKNWGSIVENYNKSFSLYLSGFSFEKVKTASIEHFHELTDRIFTTISKFSSYIFIVPVTYILLLRFLDFEGKSIVKDIFLLFLGVVFFVLIWFILFRNISDAIEAIEKDITNFKSKINDDSNLKDVKEQLDEQYKNVLPKQKRKLKIVKGISILILIVLFVAFTVIHFEKIVTLYHYTSSFLHSLKVCLNTYNVPLIEQYT